MFSFLKRRRFALTFAVESNNISPFFGFKDLSVDFSSTSKYYIDWTVTIVGKVNRDIILSVLKKEIDKCNDKSRKDALEFLLNHTTLIAWSPEE